MNSPVDHPNLKNMNDIDKHRPNAYNQDHSCSLSINISFPNKVSLHLAILLGLMQCETRRKTADTK